MPCQPNIIYLHDQAATRVTLILCGMSIRKAFHHVHPWLGARATTVNIPYAHTPADDPKALAQAWTDTPADDNNASLAGWPVPATIDASTIRKIDRDIADRLAVPISSPVWIVVDEIPANAYAYARIVRYQVTPTAFMHATSEILDGYDGELKSSWGLLCQRIDTLIRQARPGTNKLHTPAGIALRVNTIKRLVRPLVQTQTALDEHRSALVRALDAAKLAAQLVNDPDPWALRAHAGFKLFVLHQDGTITPHPPVTL